MALWFLAATAWGGFVWWSEGVPDFFLQSAAVLIFGGLQIAWQDRFLSWGRRWRGPGWVKFFLTALLAIHVYAALRAAVFAGHEAWAGSMAAGPSRPFEKVGSRWPGQFVPLFGWYVAWWGVLRVGWLPVSTSLVAAGWQSVILKGIALGHLGPREWFWLTPTHFFAGWLLMFLPGAVASHVCVPAPQGAGAMLRRALACTVPGLAWVLPVVVSFWVP